MTNHQDKRTRGSHRTKPAPTGAIRPVRVRTRPLDQIQEDKLALAFYLIARDLVEDRTEPTTAQVTPEPAAPTENGS